METQQWRLLMLCRCIIIFVSLHSPFSFNLMAARLEKSPAPSAAYIVQTPTCQIPNFSALDPLIKPFIFNERPLTCNNGRRALFASNRTAIYLQVRALHEYRIVNIRKLHCCYQYFRRAAPKPNRSDAGIVYDNECHAIKFSSATIATNAIIVKEDEEFLRVKCTYNSAEIYRDFFSFVPIRIIDGASGNDTTQTTTKRQQNKAENKENQLNILIIGIDGVSRLNFHRQMPKTAAQLRSLNATEFLGFNKIGDNSYPNLIAVLTGRNTREISATCWPTPKSYFDSCPFVWKKFKHAGYVTAFAEDSTAWSMFYYPNANGFQRKPTDYFYNHFEKAATSGSPAGPSDTCIGTRLLYQALLEYIQKFTQTMTATSTNFFAFMWTCSLTHSYLNRAKLGDQDYTNLLNNLTRSHTLNNTALFLMSDHGIRFGDIRGTYQGQMEERLPFLFLILPEWYKQKHPNIVEMLKLNTKRLITPFDIHETVLHILHKDGADVENEMSKNHTNPRGMSLFREIPLNRTCKMAGIDQHWCTCQKTNAISTKSHIVQQIARFVVDHINMQLKNHKICAKLQLAAISSAREFVNEYNTTLRSFMVVLQTNPGGAVFEATVHRESFHETFAVYSRLTISGRISRINMYGEQSRCVDDSTLKLYCYCM